MADGSGVSIPRHQRSKDNAKSSSKLRDLESGLATEDAPQGDGTSPSRRLQRIKILLVAISKRLQRRRSGEKARATDGAAQGDTLDALRGGRKSGGKRMGPVSVVAHIAFSGMTKRKPSELLFWAGFLAPWCWLIGGWMLRRDGHAVDGGYNEKRTVAPTEALAERRGEKDTAPNTRRSRNTNDDVDERNRYTTATNIAVVPSTRTSISDDRPDSAGAKMDSAGANKDSAGEKMPVAQDEAKHGFSAAWESAKNSSAEILEALRGPRLGDSQDTEATLRPGLPQESRLSVMSTTRIDPWIARCRVAAALSGLVLLALCIAAIVELVRAF